MKNILFGSVVAATLVLSGCGSSSSSSDDNGTKVEKDTTAPTVNTTVSGKKGETVTIATDDTAVTELKITGSINVTNNNDGTVVLNSDANTYPIKVVAKDAAGNTSGEKDVVITIAAAGTPSNSTWSKLDSNGSKSFVAYSEIVCPAGMSVPSFQDMNSSFNQATLNEIIKDSNLTDVSDDNGKNSGGYYKFWTDTNNTADKHLVFLIKGDGSILDAEINEDDTSNALFTCIKK